MFASLGTDWDVSLGASRIRMAHHRGQRDDTEDGGQQCSTEDGGIPAMAPSYSVASGAPETAIGNAALSIREHSSSTRRSLVDVVFSTMDPTITACGPWHDVAMEQYDAYLTCLTRSERTISFLRWGSVWNIAVTCRRLQEVMKALLRIPIYFGQVQLGRSTVVHVMGLLGCSICGAQGA